jgi:hypothetical protein
MQWGVFAANVEFEDTNNDEQPVDRNAQILGFWVAGDVVPVDDLPFTGTAVYEGGAVGTVNTDLFGEGEVQTYTARGDMDMRWDFADRSGDMKISKFDQEHFGDDGLTFEGKMCAPGKTNCSTPEGNHFGGKLSGQLDANGQNGDLPPDTRQLNGYALGSFVRGPNNYQNGEPVPGSRPQGVMGNWQVGTGPNAPAGSRYEASGVFGGRAVDR